jgi:hypothetical protein
MVSSVGSSIGDYQIAVKSHDFLLAQFQRQPSFKKAVDYYRTNIAKVQTVDDLLKDRRLLSVALSAFQLEGEVDSKGLLRKLLSQDPTVKTSLAQQLIDPRFRAFAQAFADLRNDGGAAVNDPTNVDAVLAGFQTNEYEKFISDQTGNATVRQSLFFKRTIEDTVSVSTVGNLLTQFTNSLPVSTATNYYQQNIGNVTTVDGLLGDSKLLNVALGAFDIDSKTVSVADLRQLLNAPATSSPPLAFDARFGAFRQAFGSLRSDGGTAIHAKSAVTAVVTAFQQNQFETAAASNNGATETASFGSSGASDVGRLFSQFQQRSGVADAVSYYKANIGKVRTVDDLINDPQLITVALTAFKLDVHKLSRSLVHQLLTNDPHAALGLQTQAAVLVQQDPQVAAFVKTFGSSSAGSTLIQPAASTDKVTTAFQNEQFRKSLVSKVQQAVASSTAGTISTLQILSNSTLAAVTRGALGLPTAFGALSVAQQTAGLTRAGFDPKKLQDPKFVDKFINQFLAQTDLQAANASASAAASSAGGSALSLLQSANGNSGFVDTTVPIDFSFLTGGNRLNVLV